MLADGAVDVIQFEYNRAWEAAGATLKAAADYLKSSGYRLALLQPNGLRKYDPAEFWGVLPLLKLRRRHRAQHRAARAWRRAHIKSALRR